MKKLFIIIILGIKTFCVQAQFEGLLIKAILPTHGSISWKKFPILPTIDQFNFNGLRMRVILFDDRKTLKLEKINCSDLKLTNSSEFDSPQVIFKVKEYFDSIFHESKIQIDSTSNNLLEIRLEVLNDRIVNSVFEPSETHGLCQIKIKYNDFNKVYCTDIMNKDPNSPIRNKPFITRWAISRNMVSAAIRENIEEFLNDMKVLQ